ncbi:nucleotidyltransferase family protein [Cellulosimicrobium protaetiae]|uniref:NTP transferase domain-containing protein n=1 Tax=Cellulosimicrobium protaetiae TaxID=2587808 RepID=A0A6M5UJX4_9MICO|nr:NTP transferase domain-containing protein [Cellulosimicrobium protaetiae]QJW37408.1 NTP transferase domain-containing protein [Cellulosimicrobium protaetiae]
MPTPPTSAPATTPTVGVLLAAGAGRRLGLGPKALLPHRGRPLVEHVARVLHDGGCDVVVVVLGAEADRVRAEASLGDPHVRAVVNPDWASGMASSLRAGVAAALDLAPARVVVAHVDQPGVVPDDVARLLAAHRPGRVTASRWTTSPERRARHGGRSEAENDPQVVFGVERTPRWAHPLVLDAGLAAPAAASARGDHGARDFLRAHADLIDVVDHPGDGRDLDTATDLDLLDPDPPAPR